MFKGTEYLEKERRRMMNALGLDDQLADVRWVEQDGRLGLRVEFDGEEILRRARVVWRAGRADPRYREEAKATLRQAVSQGILEWKDVAWAFHGRGR